MHRPVPDTPASGQESVWDHPRPPRVERSDELVAVSFHGVELARTRSSLRVLETSHPPVYYVPLEDVDGDLLAPTARTTVCEFKGCATYVDVAVAGAVSALAGWYYPDPVPGFELLTDAIAFYPQRVDECTVEGEVVRRVEGDFYGGWITSRVTGPFKGGPGTQWW